MKRLDVELQLSAAEYEVIQILRNYPECITPTIVGLTQAVERTGDWKRKEACKKFIAVLNKLLFEVVGTEYFKERVG